MNNPIRLLKIYARAQRLLTLLEQASASYTKEQTVSKSMFASKMFWVNVLAGGADLLGVLPLPQGWSVPALAVINIVLRTLTNQPVHVLPQS